MLLLVLALEIEAGQRLLKILIGQMPFNRTANTIMEPRTAAPSSTFFTTSEVRPSRLSTYSTQSARSRSKD